jgi:hypothetical protein
VPAKISRPLGEDLPGQGDETRGAEVAIPVPAKPEG